MINKKKIIRSVISYLPILKSVIRKRGTSPINGDYYFNIYKQHINVLISLGCNKTGTIVEFGPGDTFGIGICAILDGFSKYIAIDVIKHFNIEKNMKVLMDLRKYFNNESLFNELIKEIQSPNVLLQYYNIDSFSFEKVDLIISNAVMEHVIDLENYYRKMFMMLKPEGFCSHVIDYGAHEFSDIWYEHLYLNQKFWKFLMHGRMYPINRFPHSYHIHILK